jgi:hypothetical protein
VFNAGDGRSTSSEYDRQAHGPCPTKVTADVDLHALDVQVRDTARSVENALAEPATPVRGICPTCGRSLSRRSASGLRAREWPNSAWRRSAYSRPPHPR